MFEGQIYVTRLGSREDGVSLGEETLGPRELVRTFAGHGRGCPTPIRLKRCLEGAGPEGETAPATAAKPTRKRGQPRSRGTSWQLRVLPRSALRYRFRRPSASLTMLNAKTALAWIL